ncbi:hypothetical protein FQR65_LT08952 [Abscondita terminalis]|nr:hypothetical protein FQR65_LT08952 [Abscondita terminalis]
MISASGVVSAYAWAIVVMTDFTCLLMNTMSFLRVFTSKCSKSLCLANRNYVQVIKHYKFTTGVPEFVPVHQRVVNFFDRIAIRDEKGDYTYGNMYAAAAELANNITKAIDKRENSQVLFLCPNDVTYIITKWAIWMSGHVAVPVSNLHPRELIEYYVDDSESDLLITTTQFSELMQKVSANTRKKLMVLDENLQQNTLKKSSNDVEKPEDVDSNKNAMIVYTSGTTGKPKGVVFTHKNIISQVDTLLDAWRWTPDDTMLHVLPLNHLHGIVNALLCPLYVGAKCVMLPKFNASDVWSNLLNIKSGGKKITVFMAVPTIYSKLIQEYETIFEKDDKMKDYIKTYLSSKVRLMVSGSASLPVPVYNRWLEITGHKLLERYGMSEIGMCLSQEYDSERIPGYVGVPLKGCSVRIANQMKDGHYKTILECTNVENKIDLKYNTEITTDTSIVGELLVKGNNVFKEYYNKPELTKNEFTSDKWFITGDTCKYSIKMKMFKMLGRTNIDIIKTGGYKVSALQVETQLLGHPDILDCTVVGLPDTEYGQIIAAVVVLKNEDLKVDDLREWIKTKIPSYSVPRTYTIVKSIPKNTLGKVHKKQLILEMFSDKS